MDRVSKFPEGGVSLDSDGGCGVLGEDGLDLGEQLSPPPGSCRNLFSSSADAAAKVAGDNNPKFFKG